MCDDNYVVREPAQSAEANIDWVSNVETHSEDGFSQPRPLRSLHRGDCQPGGDWKRIDGIKLRRFDSHKTAVLEV